MIYKFDDKNNEKTVLIILSITTIGAILSIFIFDGLIIYFIAFLISAFSFYCTRNINRKNKSRIKELSINDGSIKLLFFYKSKGALALKKADYDITINEQQAIFIDKGARTILGIANKNDMEEAEKWSDLMSELTKSSNS